jgi:hypothetical protein
MQLQKRRLVPLCTKLATHNALFQTLRIFRQMNIPQANVDALGWLMIHSQRGVLRIDTRNRFIMFEIAYPDDIAPDESDLVFSEDEVERAKDEKIIDFRVTTLKIEDGLLRVSHSLVMTTDAVEAPLLLHACSVHAMKDVCREMPHIRVKTESALALLPASMPHTVQIDWDTQHKTYCVSIRYKPAIVYDADGNMEPLRPFSLSQGGPIKLHTRTRDDALESVANYRIIPS